MFKNFLNKYKIISNLIYNEFIFREFYENITLTHLEKRNIKCILNKSTYSGGFRERIPEADYVKRVRFYQPLDQFNLSRSRLNFALRNDICFDIMELIMNHYNRIVLKY